MRETDWWKTMFDQKYWDTFLVDSTLERTSKEVDFTIKVANLKPEDRILDLACGHGRHAIEFAKKGLRVTGLDYSMLFLEKAKSDVQEAGVEVKLVRGDMREIPFSQNFDAILLLYTAFGYFNDKQNDELLHQITRCLKPGGRFFLDVVSGEAVQRRFDREGIREIGSRSQKIPRIFRTGDIVVNEVERYNPKQQVIHNHREWFDKGQKIEYDFFLRVYTVPQYRELFHKSGLEFENLWGDFDGNDHDTDGNFSTLILGTKR